MENAIKALKPLLKKINYNIVRNLNPGNYKNYLKFAYRIRTGEKLNLEAPKKYTEKIQYAKLYLNSPIKTKLSDKYLVREWVEEKIGSSYLIPLLGVWEDFSEIDFEELPNEFVLKTNHGSGTNIIVKDKSQFEYHKEKEKMDSWLKNNFAYAGLELHYKDIEPRIIAEEYITDSNGELNDYKFLCFNGEVYYCWIDVGRYTNHYRNVYDLDWKLQPWTQHKYENSPNEIPKPENFDEMIKIAKKLAEGFSHVRVDLYNVDGKIYFGEMTFTNGAGYELIYPEKYNYHLGELWDFEE